MITKSNDLDISEYLNQGQYDSSYKGSNGMSTAIGSLIDGLFGLIGTGINNYQMDKTNRENRDYATTMTTAQWERDDTSLQRQVKDALNAGLSPLAVTGAMNSSTPLNSVAQAPQMDLSSLIGLASSAGSQIESEKFQAGENEKDRIHEDLQETKKLNAQIEQWNKENELEDSEQTNDIVKFNKTMIYQYDLLNSNNDNFYAGQELERLQNTSNQSLEQYKSLCSSLGVTPKTKVYSDYNEYVTALSEFWATYGTYALHRGNEQVPDTSSQTVTDNASLDSKVLGSGVGFSQQSTQSATVDNRTSNNFEYLSQYLGNAYFPVFIVGEDNKTYKNYKYDEIK